MDVSTHRYRALPLAAMLLFTFSLAGCATKSPQEEKALFVDSMTVAMDFETAWALTRDVLLEKELEIYTRDKRGLFIVYTDMHRQKIIVPWRTKLTVSLEEDGRESTTIAVETISQRYGVSLLTYPGWRDQESTDPDPAGADLLESIKSRIVEN